MRQTLLVLMLLISLVYSNGAWAQGDGAAKSAAATEAKTSAATEAKTDSKAGAVSQSGHEKDHEELTALRQKTQEAINTRKFDILKPYLSENNLTVITVDGQKFESLQAFQEYWNKLFEKKEYSLDKIEVNPVADGPTEFLSDTVGICHGTSKDSYYFKNGDVRIMPERWTAVVLKDATGWKVSRILFSANILDNPVMTAIEKEMEKAILIAAISGAVVGAIAGALFFSMLKKKA